MQGCCFFFSSRRRHTRYIGDWSSDVCSSDLIGSGAGPRPPGDRTAAAGAQKGGLDPREKWQVIQASRMAGDPVGALPLEVRSEERRVGREGGCGGCTGSWKGSERGM